MTSARKRGNNMDNFAEEKTSSASGFPEDFEALFKNSEEWRLNAECLKKYITEKTNEEKKHAAERFEKASAVFDKASQNGCEFFSGVCEREKKFAKNRLDSINSDQLLPEIKEINVGFEKLYSSSKEKYRQSSNQMKAASDAVQKSKSSFVQKNIEWRKSKLSRTTSVNGEPAAFQEGNLTLKQNKIYKKLKDSEKEWEVCVDRANAKHEEFERLKDEIAGKIYDHMEKTEKAINGILESLLDCLNCSQKEPPAGSGEFENGGSILLRQLGKFRTRERSQEPRFTFNPVDEITRTFSPPMLRKSQRKSSEPILDSMKSDWPSRTLTSGKGSDKFRNSSTEFSNLDSDTKIKLIKMSLTQVDNQGLDYKGIYRQSGSEARFKMLSEKMLATDGDDCDEIFSETDIYTIARYTKNLLMNANELLFTKKVKQEILKIFKRISGDKISESTLEELKTCLKKLPPKNEALLMMVFQHLNKVATKCKTNLMTPSNLALIFSPALFSYRNEGTYNSQFKTCPKITEVFINDYRFLFDLDSTNDQNMDQVAKEDSSKAISTGSDDVFRQNSPTSQNLSKIPEQNNC